MKLKQGISLPAFLEKVKKCQGEVNFKTDEGDCLNLKSILTTYIFITLLLDPKMIADGYVTCEKSEDYQLLSEYLVT